MKKKAYIGTVISILIALIFSLSVLGDQGDRETASTYANHNQKNSAVKNITIDAQNIVRFVELREEQRLIEEQERLRLEEEKLEQERIEKEEEKLRLEEQQRKEQEQERIEEQKRAKEKQADTVKTEEREDKKEEQQTSKSNYDPVEEESNKETEEKQEDINYQGIRSYEKEVVTYTNMEREKHGLSKLKMDSKLSEVAWHKSKDMEVNGYFSHTSPTYGSPFEMMTEFGVSYTAAGENIAMGYPDAKSVVNGWMNSEGHRKNILNENYTHIGVGFVQNGYYATQMFKR